MEREFGLRLGLTAVGELLAKLGLTPQKPLQRAYQRDPAAIETWRRETFPAIARQAKATAERPRPRDDELGRLAHGRGIREWWKPRADSASSNADAPASGITSTRTPPPPSTE